MMNVLYIITYVLNVMNIEHLTKHNTVPTAPNALATASYDKCTERKKDETTHKASECDV